MQTKEVPQWRLCGEDFEMLEQYRGGWKELCWDKQRQRGFPITPETLSYVSKGTTGSPGHVAFAEFVGGLPSALLPLGNNCATNSVKATFIRD